ncbi:MAG: amidohydrolase [Bacteroidia bacterium]
MELEVLPGPLRVCLVQMDLAWENPQENWSRAANMLHGQEGKHDLIILPEMFSTGFTMKPQGIAEPAADGDTLAWMQHLANKMDAVVVGSVVVEEAGGYYNRLMVVNHAGLVLKYDKRHLFRMAGEHEVYRAGAELQVFSLNGWRICPMVCYDLRFPVWSRNGMNPEGRMWYDLLLYVANWPERRVAHWKALLQARAIENQAYVAGVNRAGTDGNEIDYSGDSLLFAALGQQLGHGGREATLITAELDWDSLAAYREKFPAWADADQFELLG